MSVTIAEEFLLLAHSDQDGKQLIDSMHLDPAVAGALLADLAIAGRIELAGKKLRVADPSPLGHPELDATLARIVQEGGDRRPAWWVHKLQSGKLRNRLLTGLAEAGVLAERHRKVLGVFPSTRWPQVDPGVQADVRERVSAVLAGADPDARTAALIAITYAARFHRKAFPGADRKRIKEIAEGVWTSAAVAKAIAAIQAGVTGAAAAGMVAVGASGSS
ncbi:GOLPH3/VPS74 family protein [Nonomuraea jiangxiensis]|uniref:Golgi phosphoprotein 3 (GPP34) n=1 Tax=Nonomuraea jiangxiensis TaxID=633440 RepID=A0A1G9QI41_9ACTN|nr:GPP34 family phosphoprotein [Nonomuraea jiangxiensis]SDM09955.1 Golgi phosphoprotein 3 (GPP34) [Nonomuraea jiangxiensis]